MPQVDFYVLNDETEKAQLYLACKLADKTYQTQKCLYIHCKDQAQANIVDDMLWSFNANSFIPHGLLEKNRLVTLPILIGCDESTAIKCDVLLNLDHEIPTIIDNYKRIIEIVYQNQEAKKLARMRYKTYQDKGLSLESHHLS